MFLEIWFFSGPWLPNNKPWKHPVSWMDSQTSQFLVWFIWAGLSTPPSRQVPAKGLDWGLHDRTTSRPAYSATSISFVTPAALSLSPEQGWNRTLLLIERGHLCNKAEILGWGVVSLLQGRALPRLWIASDANGDSLAIWNPTRWQLVPSGQFEALRIQPGFLP